MKSKIMGMSADSVLPHKQKEAFHMKKFLVSSMIVFSLFFSVQSYASIVISDGLVAAYEFEGNADDTSGNAINGTIFGATFVTDRFGNPNSACYFDGDDYILASASMLPTAERTVALWFNANLVTNSPNLVAYGGSDFVPPGKSWLMGINHWGESAFSITSHWDTNTLQYYYTTAPVDKWIHYAITTDSSGTKIYINGVEMASNSTFINNTTVIGTDLAMGVAVDPYGFAPYTDENVGYFIGSMDDVLIYDRALNSSEIERIATVPLPPTALLLATGFTFFIMTKFRRKLYDVTNQTRSVFRI